MKSGGRRNIMVACVTFETVKISEPVHYYRVHTVHLLHYIRDPESERGSIYAGFFEETSEQISSSGAEVVEHNVNVSNFPDVIREVESILGSEYSEHPDSDIYVNLSSGSSEYISAATIVSMMYPKSIPFTVSTKEYTVDLENVKKLYYDGDRPVGLSRSVTDPSPMVKISIPHLDEILVRGLRAYVNCNCKTREAISLIKSEGLWLRGESKSEEYSKQYDVVWFHRDFVQKWINLGWVERDEHRRRFNLTDDGRWILRTYFT